MSRIFQIYCAIFRGSSSNRPSFFQQLRYYSNGKEADIDYLLNATYSTMPKQVTHTIALKKHRLKLKEKSLKYTPGTVNLQVLGSGANGAPRSLYIFTDQSRYLFNCGEGTQRLAHEHKMKLSKLEHIFITHPIWENIGGLPGVSLTIQDVGVPQITIHGPPGTDEIFTATRRFVVLRNLAIKMASCTKDTVFEDNVMRVQYIPLYTEAAKQWMSKSPSSRSPLEQATRSDESTDDDVDYYSYWKRNSRSNSPDRAGSPSSKKKRRHHSPESRNERNGIQVREERPPAGSVSIAYICRLQDRPGMLNLKACVAQGVPPGPLLGKLKAGEDITLPDGKVVLSKDVTSPDEPGPVFIVVECPTEEFLDGLCEEEAFKKHQAGTDNINEAAFLVVHFSPPEIMELPRYQKWMEQFLPSTHHLVMNSSNECMGSVAVHRIQHKLNMLSDKLFPLLADQNTNSDCQVDMVGVSGIEEMRSRFAIVRGHTFSTIQLRPQRMIECSGKLVLEPDIYRKETLNVNGFPRELSDLRQQLVSMPDDGRKFPQIVFLGTGSCIPNKTRNTSGILIHLSESSCIIVDCGEATYGQIVRLYGAEQTRNILRCLRAIYVSHLHADHHIGLMGLLKARLRVLQFPQPMFLLAPRQIKSWLNTYHQNFDPVLTDLEIIPNNELLYNDYTLASPTMSKLLTTSGLSEVRTCVVRHCPNAFGVAFSHPDGWKITYSGDTMPCDDLIQLGKSSDLLIHEATMEDDLEAEAKLKMHSTTSQAIEVGRQMGARYTLLTHFSQRYAKVPIFNDSFTSDVGIAFDNMQVTLGDLPKLPLMYPALKLMFAEHYEEMELKAVKRQLQQEREMAKGYT